MLGGCNMNPHPSPLPVLGEGTVWLLSLTPSMQLSIAAFIGLSKNLFGRSEFIFAPMKSRSDPIVGWPFLWFRFF